MDAIGVVDDAVEDRVDDRGFADDTWLCHHGDLTGDEDGLVLVALLDDLEEIARSLGVEALKPRRRR